MNRIIEHIRDLLFRGVPLGSIRSAQWPEVQKAHIAKFPACASCNTKGNILNKLNVHHCTPYHLDKSKELDEQNLITLCRKCHFFVGHLYSWKSFNITVREDAKLWKQKIKDRP